MKKLKHVKIGDTVEGRNGPVAIKGKTEVQHPKFVYEITFSNGRVVADGSHLWVLVEDGLEFVTDTLDLFYNTEDFKNCRVGRSTGPGIIKVEKIEGRPVQCLEIDDGDGMFAIYTDTGNKVFTHNCGFRAACGYLGTNESIVALDGSTAGTTVDGEHKGAGLIKAYSKIEHIQYYYSEFKGLEEYYRRRGLDEMGFGPISAEDAEMEELSGTVEITPDGEKVKIEFSGEEAELDRRADQKFEEI